jgi:hypothetical protein
MNRFVVRDLAHKFVMASITTAVCEPNVCKQLLDYTLVSNCAKSEWGQRDLNPHDLAINRFSYHYSFRCHP